MTLDTLTVDAIYSESLFEQAESQYGGPRRKKLR
jgi:hypothetical protein